MKLWSSEYYAVKYKKILLFSLFLRIKARMNYKMLDSFIHSLRGIEHSCIACAAFW